MISTLQHFGKMYSPVRYSRLLSRTFASFSLSKKLSISCQHLGPMSKFSSMHGCTSDPRVGYFHVQHVKTLQGSMKYSTQSDDREQGSLIYTGRVGSMFKMLKIFSLTTSAIGLSLQPYLFVTYQDAPLVTAIPFFAALNMFVFVNPFLIHYIGKKYVMEVYFNQQTRVFTAVMLTFFARKYNFTFRAEDVRVPDVPGLFSILTIKGRPLFVLDSDFTDVEVYKHMMGFDKPLDLTFLKDNEKGGS